MLLWQETTTDYVNSIQDAINDAKAKAEDFNSREKVIKGPCRVASEPHPSSGACFMTVPPSRYYPGWGFTWAIGASQPKISINADIKRVMTCHGPGRR